MKKYFVLAYCFVCALLVSCQQEENGVVVTDSENGVVVTDSSSEEVCEIGFYHNEILKNFIEIRQQPHSRAISIRRKSSNS